MFADLIDKIIDSYKADPRNKIAIDEDTLLASSIEETGYPIKRDQLRNSIANYLSNEMNGDDYSIYDGAIYVCSVAANHCFGDPVACEDDDYYSVDYQLSWIQSIDGSFIAEIRPNQNPNLILKETL
jgi:hypothetical protein